MQIHKLSNAFGPGHGIYSVYAENLRKEGYTVIDIRLDQLSNDDFNLPIPEIFKGPGFLNEPQRIVKKYKDAGAKIALYLDEYENNKNRITIIREVAEEGNNYFGLGENDILFFKAND